jgi:RHS repeat-associated protein
MTLHARGGLLRAMWLLAGLALAGTRHDYYTAPQGTPLAKTDANGTILATYDYAPYGTPVAGLSGAPNGPGYTGHVNDPDTGFVYMQARYYDPAVGRFLSVDPVGSSPGNAFNFNRYAYASNNPIVNIDPDGKRDIYIGGAGDKRWSHIVQDYAAQQKSEYPSRDIQYVSYGENLKIAKLLSEPLSKGEPLNIIGHSLGGREAIKAVNATSMKITNLITIDSVGRAGNGVKPTNVSVWTNITTSPTKADRDESDKIASAGRFFMGTTNTSGADISKNSTTNHAVFDTMMDQIDAKKLINHSYLQNP